MPSTAPTTAHRTSRRTSPGRRAPRGSIWRPVQPSWTQRGSFWRPKRYRQPAAFPGAPDGALAACPALWAPRSLLLGFPGVTGGEVFGDGELPIGALADAKARQRPRQAVGDAGLLLDIDLLAAQHRPLQRLGLNRQQRRM